MAGNKHFTKIFSNYNFHYYSIPGQPYAQFSHGKTTTHYFLQLHVPNPQNGPNHSLSFSKLPYFNSDMLSVHHSMQPNSLKPLHSNNKFYASCSTPWYVDAQHFILVHFSQNNAKVVTWQQSVTHTSSIQLCSNNFTMAYPLSCTKLLIIFGKDNQTSILNLQTTPSSSYLKYRMNYYSDMHTFLYYTDNLNPAHYNFTAVYMWNNANYIDKCYTNIHT
jgi:hypothetical protein